jgi:hypothetical protein
VEVRELLGQRDLTLQEIARIFGAKIDQPGLVYTQFSAEQTIAGLIAAGLSESFAQLYAEMMTAINADRVRPSPVATPAIQRPHASRSLPTSWPLLTARFDERAKIFARAPATLISRDLVEEAMTTTIREKNSPAQCDAESLAPASYHTCILIPVSGENLCFPECLFF